MVILFPLPKIFIATFCRRCPFQNSDILNFCTSYCPYQPKQSYAHGPTGTCGSTGVLFRFVSARNRPSVLQRLFGCTGLQETVLYFTGPEPSDCSKKCKTGRCYHLIEVV
jgi:hypothetical protein